jgi:Spy/CpxP family protein refolding chaperone
MKKMLSIFAMLAIVANMSAQGVQKEAKPAMNPGMEKGYLRANPQDLAPKFTEEQKKQIADFKLSRDKQLIQINNLLNEKKAQLKTLQQADKPDMKKINAKIDEITDLQNQKMKLNATFKNNVRSILTEEQRVKMDMMREHQGNNQGRPMIQRQIQIRTDMKPIMTGPGQNRHNASCPGCPGCKESSSCKDSVKVIKVKM